MKVGFVESKRCAVVSRKINRVGGKVAVSQVRLEHEASNSWQPRRCIRFSADRRLIGYPTTTLRLARNEIGHI